MRALQRSQHGTVRGLATEALRGADAFAWPVGESGRWHCPAALARLLRSSRQTSLDELRSRLLGPDNGAALDAVRLVVRFGVCREMVDVLDRLGFDTATDPRLAAAAIGALPLGHEVVGSERLSRIAQTAADHADGRVRANAVENLARSSAPGVCLDGFLEDRVPRVRANAARGCVTRDGTPDGPGSMLGLVALDTMLGDSRATHRRSSLWVVNRIGDVRLLDSVRRVANDDSDRALRRRARRIAHRLTQRAASRSAGPRAEVEREVAA